ncbi:MAG: hypothetical protein EOP07_09490 [Proteobacteria bacterium]|nr:MAG: hypothetical protein EOP07_09490 [Pseudomonadota bacterium]
MPLGNKESGSTALVAMAGIVSLALATTFVQQSSIQTKQAIDQAQLQRAVEEKNVGATSAISHYKSLITTSKHAGKYKPALFANNYFATSWQLQKSKNSSSKANQKSTVETEIMLREPALNEKAVKAAMQNTTGPTMESFNVTFIKPNFDSAVKLVKSVDVEVTGRYNTKSGSEKIKIVGRIPLPPPFPYDPKLMYRKPGGAWIEMKDGADLSDGPFEFVANVSGIAFDADFLVDGVITKTFGGRENGQVTHKAVNYDNVGGEVGPVFFYDPAPEPDPVPVVATSTASGSTGGSGGAAPDTTGASSDGTSCGFVKGSYAGGGGAGGGGATATPPAVPVPTPSPALPVQGTFQLIVRGPDGVEDELGKTSVFKVRIRKDPPPPPPAVASDTGGSGGTLTLGDYKTKCTAACPYYGHDLTDRGDEMGAYGAYVGAGPVCFAFPGGPILGYPLHDSDVWVYDTNSCKGAKLFHRGTCGCLTGDSKILLGDNKTEKRIDELNEWDRVWNPVLKKSFAVRKYTQGPELKPLIRISVGDRSIDATSEHPFVTDHGLRTASQLLPGDRMRLHGDRWENVKAVESIPVPEVAPIVWNLELEGPNDDLNSHYVVANGIVTGDLLIQNRLKAEPKLSQAPANPAIHD